MKSKESLQPEHRNIEAKKLIGMSMNMSIIKDSTYKLFSSFMPRKKEIQHIVNSNTFDLRVYPSNYFRTFNPATEFTKWALVEISEIKNIPEGMQLFNLKGGLYIVFTHIGDINDSQIFQEIFTSWLPNSGFTIDNRPHFEIMFPQEKNQNKLKQEIYIPIK